MQTQNKSFSLQLVKPRRLVDTNGFHHDFEEIGNETCAGSGLRLVQDRPQSGVCSSFGETENEVHDEERYEPAWLGARRNVAQCGCRDADGLGEMECDGAFAQGNGDGSQKSGNQRDRVECALPSNLEKAESAEARETPGQDQGECRDGESPQENAKQAFQLELDSKTRKPESVLTNFFQELHSIPANQEEATQSERRHWVELWKNLRVDCAGGMLISPKKLEKSLEEIEQRERFTRSNHSRRFESIAFRMFGEIGEIVVVDVLGYDFPGRLCSMTLMAPKVVGATCLTKFRPIARLCAMRTVLLRLAQVAPSTELRKCADCVCAEDTCRCWFVSAVESGRIVSRVAERNCGGTAGREESVRPCGPSSGLQGNEAARCELVLDGFDCCNLEWKLYESAKGDGLVEQSSDESRTHRSLRSSLQ